MVISFSKKRLIRILQWSVQIHCRKHFFGSSFVSINEHDWGLDTQPVLSIICLSSAHRFARLFLEYIILSIVWCLSRQVPILWFDFRQSFSNHWRRFVVLPVWRRNVYHLGPQCSSVYLALGVLVYGNNISAIRKLFSNSGKLSKIPRAMGFS